MKFLILLFILPALALFAIFNFGSSNYKSPSYVILADKLIKETGIELAKKYNMDVIGTGGSMYDNVKMLSLSFNLQGPKSKQELEKILVDSVEIFLSKVNGNVEIREYLNNFPFLPENIEIEIYLQDSSGREIYDPNFSVATARKGKLFFHTVDFQNVRHYKNTYEEDFLSVKKRLNKK